VFSVETKTDGMWVVISISGELDVGTAPTLKQALLLGSLPGGRTYVALDLSGLTFCDSAGLGVFVSARSKLLEHGGDLVLMRPTKNVERVLQVSGLRHLFTSTDYPHGA
jgi:anti-sigma B factor antagonist